VVKKFGKKGYCKVLAKKTLANVVTVKRSRTIQFQTSMNIIKWTPYFPGFILCHVLLACCLMMARCTVESMIRGYHQYISKLSFESELDLLNVANIDILTSILTQNKLKRTSRCCVRLMLQNRNIGEKKLANCCDSPNSPKFFPFQSFLLYGKYSSQCEDT